MKKLITLVIGIIFICQSALGQDTWSPIVTDGFGSKLNNSVNEFAVFKDTLYACVAITGSGIAEIHRSGTGDAGDWNPVTYDSQTTNIKGIPSINTTTLGGGYMWIETGNAVEGTQVYRTQNGRDWIPISKKGFGNSARWSPSPSMILFQGTGDSIPYLYAGAGSHGGAAKSQVWRAPYTDSDSTKWDLLVDFGTRDTNCTQITYFHTWNNKIYFGGNGDSLLYESSNGTTFVANTGVASDFLTSDQLIACMVDFNGYLYASTNNQAIGGQLWRTNDGNSWQNLTSVIDGYDGTRDEELHNMDTSNGYLWITPYTRVANSNGSPIFRSTDSTGTSFIQSNTDGFGDSNNDGENAVSIGFKGRQYFGGPNSTDGGQIWRTDVLSGMKKATELNCHSILSPNPFTDNAVISVSHECSGITNVDIYDMTGRLIKTITGLRDNKVIIARGTLPTGMYFYNLQTTDGTSKAGKLIIK
ncbi:MAG: T9SS type A sorting domain-containing protein [Bacteroidia bacterium]|nr:T9SS type A sorting domain-containing protein [Bacteroidia bacterium]